MTASTTQDQAAVATAVVKNISHIATLPEITLKIIELVEDPASTAQDLHNIIANDPALCSRILKVVNSAFYGLPRQIGSINRAIVLLGLNAVKNIAIAASLAKLFRGGELCSKFSARDLWIHSIATGTAGKLIADELKLGLPDEAFLAGLIHDIGIMVEMQAERLNFVEVFETLELDDDGVPKQDMRTIETTVFGRTTSCSAPHFARRGNSRGPSSYVAGHHHDPQDLPDNSRTLAWIVHVADRIAGTLKLGFHSDLCDTSPNPAALNALKLSLGSVEGIKSMLPKAIEEIEATFGA